MGNRSYPAELSKVFANTHLEFWVSNPKSLKDPTSDVSASKGRRQRGLLGKKSYTLKESVKKMFKIADRALRSVFPEGLIDSKTETLKHIY